ncbi:hypothetical protein SynPROS91_01769 [Synechococcus sp. PROS-9-1]|nr:hypothetical protein SynPROS91_01769 [Synechococcus sp. PROS-9-1]
MITTISEWIASTGEQFIDASKQLKADYPCAPVIAQFGSMPACMMTTLACV